MSGTVPRPFSQNVLFAEVQQLYRAASLANAFKPGGLLYELTAQKRDLLVRSDGSAFSGHEYSSAGIYILTSAKASPRPNSATLFLSSRSGPSVRYYVHTVFSCYPGI